MSDLDTRKKNWKILVSLYRLPKYLCEPLHIICPLQERNKSPNIPQKSSCNKVNLHLAIYFCHDIGVFFSRTKKVKKKKSYWMGKHSRV